MKIFSQLFSSKSGAGKKSAQKQAKLRSKLTSWHVLIAAVAIIECLILIAFTTYSWIETASSLIIWNGKKSIVQEEAFTKMHIRSALDYEFKISSADTNVDSAADLNTYFSEVGQSLYRYARTSSPDGKTFYFRNPSNAKAAYRIGDTTDYNTSYTYFDFLVSNGGYTNPVKMKFEFADDDIFTVTPGTSGLSSDQCEAVKNAMRISFQAGAGSPKIYSETAQEYSAQNGTASGSTKSIVSTAIAKDTKIFAVAKTGTTRVGCRIWFEQNAANLTGITATQLAGVDIQVNLRLKYRSNEYDFVYFDDYTFSNKQDNNGGHLTEDYSESQYRVYFVYKTSAADSSATVYPMTLDTSNTNSDAVRWVTCTADGTPDATLPSSGTGNANAYNVLTTYASQYSYFAYGTCALGNSSLSNTTSMYTWKISDTNSNQAQAQAAGDESELIYNAFSVTKTSASAAYGAGGWASKTPLTMVYFRDLVTGLTNQPYNTGNNFKYITDAVNVAADNDSSKNRNDVMFVNYQKNEFENVKQAPHTATMYYDKSLDNGNGLFKAWVPSYWLTANADDTFRMFRYCNGGYFTNCVASWAAPVAAKAVGSDDYIYTGLGSREEYTTDYYDGTVYPSHADFITQGTGTWNKIENEPICLSAELIDNKMTPNQRFRIGVKIGDSSTYAYYAMVPDESNTKFYAYIPDPKNGSNSSTADYTDGDICFEGFTFGGYTTTGDYQAPATNALWTAQARTDSRTYYPVKFDSTADNSGYTRGYWHISVIVDGTYEHLFWEPANAQTGDEARVLGNFSYNTTGHPTADDAAQYTDITAYELDEYRWYVPLNENADMIYYRWEPYTGTVLKFNHNTNDGIYCIVTEGAKAVSD